MLGRNDMRELKEALDACGCDMGAFRCWQKQYEKLVKQMPSVRAQYENALYTTQEVYVTVQELEKLIVEEAADAHREFAGMIKSLKKAQNTFGHEFIISRDDREFHSTYESVVRLGAKSLEDAQQRLILQSEIENLLALLKENLEKEEPQLQTLCYFYQEHSDQELTELTPAGRVERIVEVYQREFALPIAQLLLDAIPYADSRRSALESSSDRRDKKELERLKLLWNRPGEELTPQERSQRIFQELMDKGEER